MQYNRFIIKKMHKDFKNLNETEYIKLRIQNYKLILN